MQQAYTQILLVIEDLEIRSQLRKQLKNLGYWVAESTLDLAAEVVATQTQSHVSGRVLVVEDDAVSRKMLTLHLEHRGYEVSVAEDGLVAKELLAKSTSMGIQGAGVLFQVAHKLKVDKIHLLLNQVALQADQELLRGRLQDTFGSEVAALLPRFESDGQGIRQPNSPWAEALRALTVRLLQP
ncbi:response regulator [bacterium]|nr:response regulator [bacterium]